MEPIQLENGLIANVSMENSNLNVRIDGNKEKIKTFMDKGGKDIILQKVEEVIKDAGGSIQDIKFSFGKSSPTLPEIPENLTLEETLKWIETTTETCRKTLNKEQFEEYTQSLKEIERDMLKFKEIQELLPFLDKLKSDDPIFDHLTTTDIWNKLKRAEELELIQPGWEEETKMEIIPKD
jgi:hypothetical protein